MFERIQNDGVTPKMTTASGSPRAELVISPAPASSELREKAVAPTGDSQRTTSENALMHPLMQVIGQVSEEMDAVAQSDAQSNRLEKIFSKLFKAYGEASRGVIPEGMDSDVDKILKDIEETFVSHSDSEGPSVVVPVEENVAAQATRQQREKTLEKISVAMRKVGVLRDKLGGANERSHDRLVNINSSMADLNIARAQLDGSSFSISSASLAVDSVMSNLRSAVFAHGKISADVVRLVMS
jgi:hypothetical protein